MKKSYLIVILGLLCMFSLVACNSDEGANDGEPVAEDQNQETEENDAAVDDTENTVVNEDEESDSDLITESEFGDQLDLQIGDTGQVQTNLDAFEVTLDSVRKETEVDGELPQLDFFIIADLTLTNISDIDIDAGSAKGTLEITKFLDGSGFSDLSGQGYEGIEEIEGTLVPGESIEGQFIVQMTEGEEEYYLRITGGLLAAGGVLNDVRWTFTESDLE